jgi:hypothetical protein
MAKKTTAKKTANHRPHLRLVDTEGPAPADPPRRKLIAFDPETFSALDVYRRDSMKDWDELAEEAFRDLLNKHGRSADLRTALKRSAKQAGDVAKSEAPKDTPKSSKRSTRSKRW